MIVQSKNYWNWKRGLNISGFTAKFVVLHCTFCTLHSGIWGFSAPPSIKQNRTKTKTKTELRAGQRKSWWCVEFLPTEGGRHCSFASDKNKKGQKNIWSKLVDYGLKCNDHKQRTLKHRNKTNRAKSSNRKLKTMTLWTCPSKCHVFPKRTVKMIDWTEKPKIPLKLAKRTAQYNEFGSINGRTT